MRKILLATTAIVGIAAAGAAQAATSPLTVNLGGSVDAVAGLFHESAASEPSGTTRASHDFETIYDLNVGVNGKTSNGIEYGGNLSFGDTPDISNAFNAANTTFLMTQADVFMSGAFGKVVVGDSHGATDLAVAAPTVGEGQTQGRYIDFVDTASFGKNFVAGVDGTDHSTNLTYFTPKVGNDANKVQAGVTYEPNMYNYGGSVVKYQTGNQTSGAQANNLSPYSDVVKGALAYTGTFHPVTVGVSADVINGTTKQHGGDGGWLSGSGTLTGKDRDFTSFGVGAQAAAQGFTLGGGYDNWGHYDSVGLQNKTQQSYNAGLKYEFGKIGVGVNYLGGEGYGNHMSFISAAKAGTGSSENYIKDFESEGLGGTYTWAPGLTSNLDGVLFQQKTDTQVRNDGYVLLVSQKLAF